MDVNEIFPEKTFGLGGVPFGNEFGYVTDDVAYATLEAAWNAGVRYYDVAPWYGLGLAERRLGSFLHKQKRSDYVLSSKVGKLLTASPNNEAKKWFPYTPSPNNVRLDYTSDGVKRSIEDTLQRMGVDSIDIAFVHDLSPDNPLLQGQAWEEHFEIARKGAFPTLSKLRDEGLIKAWGVGVNTPEPILRLMQVADANLCLLAKQYSLIDHKTSVEDVFPKARANGMKFVVGTSLNAGFISGSSRYNYGEENYKIPPAVIEKRNRLRSVAAKHGVDLRTAAMQFSMAPDVAAALIVGVANPQQALDDATAVNTKIPDEFWMELRSEGLIERDAAVPVTTAAKR